MEVQATPVERPTSRVRLVALVALVGGLLIAARATGLHQRVTLEGVRQTVLAAGPLGPAAFVLVFCLGELLHVPGLLFVAAGLLVWGPVAGGALSFVAALASVSCTFLLVRAVGGRVTLDRPAFVARLLAGLEARPVRTVALLRAVLVLSPPLNYALALTGLRFRDHLVGSALGLLLPIGAAALAAEWVVERAS